MNLQDYYHLRIKQLGGIYDPGSNLSLNDQFHICESIHESSPVLPTYYSNKEENTVIDNTSVNGNLNDGCRQNINFELTQNKQLAVTKLEVCSYKTPPREIAQILQEFFVDTPSKEGHWLYIAQHWNPRAILRVLQNLIKLHSTGRISFRNPAGYFTYLIKFRKKRKNI